MKRTFDLVVVGGVFREILLQDGGREIAIGGSGATAAIVAGRSGISCALVSYVGEDDADAVIPLLEAAGVAVGSVLVLPGASGTFMYSADSKCSAPWPMYRPAERTPSTPPPIPGASVYLAFGIPDLDPIQEGWLNALTEDRTLIWDRQGWLSRARDSSSASHLRARRKVYLANLEETLEEFDLEEECRCLQLMPPEGFSEAVIKMGPRGVFVSQRDIPGTIVEGFPVASSITVGSGDVFAGAFGASLAGGESIEDAARVGNATASSYLELMRDPFHPALLDGAANRLGLGSTSAQ